MEAWRLSTAVWSFEHLLETKWKVLTCFFKENLFFCIKLLHVHLIMSYIYIIKNLFPIFLEVCGKFQ